MVGLGGKGVLYVGQLLAQAGVAEYENVLYFSDYGVQKRGGHVLCNVILSQNSIACPLLSTTEAMIIFEPSLIGELERVTEGGTAIIESAQLTADTTRSDITVLPVPAVETAAKMGNPQMANLILLGAYVAACKTVSPGLIEDEIARKGSTQVMQRNLNAFRQGLELIKA